jgi:AraC-like DNA-binding protein
LKPLNSVGIAWVGRAWIAPGMAVFRGSVGAHDWHQHLAHQITVGLKGAVEVETPARSLRGRALVIPAGMRHRLSGGAVLSIYVDALAPEATALRLRPHQPALALDLDLARQLLVLANTDDLATVQGILRSDPPPAADNRLQAVVRELRACRGETNRHSLAAIVHVSPERFSHWFVEQTGLPLRSYLKWVRLIETLRHLAAGGTLTEAAHLGGFSDSAHLSRTFRAMLGGSPANLLRQVALSGAID